MLIPTKLHQTTIISALSEHYDIKNVTSTRRVWGGWNNATYFIDSGYGSFFLKIYQDTRVEQLFAEQEVITELLNLDFPTARVFKTVNREGIANVNGHYIVLFTALRGAPLIVNPFETTLGKTIAEKLSTLRKVNRDKLLYITEDNIEELIEKNVSRYLNDHRNNQFRKELDDFYSGLSNITFSNLTHGVIHNDLGLDNILVHNSKLSGIIDFDQTVYGAVIKDLAKFFARSLNFNVYRLDKLPKDAYEFINHYSHFAGLNNSDLHAFFPLFMFQKIVIFFKLNRHIHEKTLQAELLGLETYLKNVEAELNTLFSHYKSLEHKFLSFSQL